MLPSWVRGRGTFPSRQWTTVAIHNPHGEKLDYYLFFTVALSSWQKSVGKNSGKLHLYRSVYRTPEAIHWQSLSGRVQLWHHNEAKGWSYIMVLSLETIDTLHNTVYKIHKIMLQKYWSQSLTCLSVMYVVCDLRIWALNIHCAWIR